MVLFYVRGASPRLLSRRLLEVVAPVARAVVAVRPVDCDSPGPFLGIVLFIRRRGPPPNGKQAWSVAPLDRSLARSFAHSVELAMTLPSSIGRAGQGGAQKWWIGVSVLTISDPLYDAMKGEDVKEGPCSERMP